MGWVDGWIEELSPWPAGEVSSSALLSLLARFQPLITGN